MFHWICPECGHEIAPGVKECPVCDPQASASPLPAPKKVELQPEVEIGPTAAIHSAAVIQPTVIVHPTAAIQAAVVPVALLAPPEVEPVQPKLLPAAPVPIPVEETFAHRLADLTEVLQGQRTLYDAQRLTAMPRRETERAPVVLDVTPASSETTAGKPSISPSSSMPMPAEPQPPSVAAEIPVRSVLNPQPAAPPEGNRAFRNQPRDAEPSSPSPVQLPDHPAGVTSPALGSFLDYHKAAERQMRPAPLATKGISGTVEPKVTLPGPAIPRELMSLQAAGLVPIQIGRRNSSMANRYGWTGRIAGMAILLTAGIAATYRVLPGISSSSQASSDSKPVVEQPEVTKSESSHSLARAIEVTGIRFLDLNKKPQLHYLVVNHSGAPLGSMTIYITLRLANAKPGQAPLSRFSFRSPNLAAFEAKEMASPIERISSSLDLPDWQDLRAEVDVQ